jgi:hypothetical protein
MWKDIPNYENLYEVNELGEVRNKKTKALLTGDINNGGYYRVCLYYGKPKKYFRHRLVAELFLDNPNNYTEVNHIDGNKANNNVNNLEWVDRTKNEREARRTGLKEYKPYYVIWDNGERQEFEFAIELANILGVTDSSIRNYLKGRTQGYKQFGIKEIEYL